MSDLFSSKQEEADMSEREPFNVWLENVYAHVLRGECQEAAEEIYDRYACEGLAPPYHEEKVQAKIAAGRAREAANAQG